MSAALLDVRVEWDGLHNTMMMGRGMYQYSNFSHNSTYTIYGLVFIVTELRFPPLPFRIETIENKILLYLLLWEMLYNIYM